MGSGGGTASGASKATPACGAGRARLDESVMVLLVERGCASVRRPADGWLSRASRVARRPFAASGGGYDPLGRDLEHGQQRDPGAAKEDQGDQVTGRMEAVGPARDD